MKMKPETEQLTILLAEDNPDDQMLTMEAFAKSRMADLVIIVEDGEEVMDYLYRRGKYKNPETSPRPALILLDLNMPRKDGREVLGEIKNEPALKTIPVVVLTTSKAREDIICTYDLGGSSFITKPFHFSELVDIVRIIGNYWLGIVELPPDDF